LLRDLPNGRAEEAALREERRSRVEQPFLRFAMGVRLPKGQAHKRLF